MCDTSLQFDLHDKQNQENLSANSLQTNYAEISDLNGGNYSNGLITFSNVNLQNALAGSVFDLTEALYHIPVVWKATIAGGTFTSTATAADVVRSNKYAVTKKANHHFFHNCWTKIGSVPIEKNNSGYTNFYINEVKKRKSTVDSITDDVDSIYFDSPDSYNYVFTNAESVGESNNYSERSLIANPSLLDYNRAIFKRNGHMIDISSGPANALLPANPDSEFSQIWQPYFTNGATTLQWNDVLVGKISDFNPIFDKIPPLFHLNGFDLTNALGDVQFKVASIISNLGNGQTCPLLLSSASTTGLAGLTFMQTANATAVKITLTCTVGWGNSNPAPCRLLIPYHKLDNSALDKIYKNPIYTFYSNNFYLDNTIVGIQGGQLVQKTLATHYNRPRKMYIIPFLSNQNKVTNAGTTTFMISPFQSPLSSAPTTCSLCKLKNFNVLLGGASLFSQQALYSPAHFYDQNYRMLNCLDYSYGNANSNPLKSGRVSKSDFLKGPYGVYVVDLYNSIDDEDDQVAKSLGVQFTVDAPNTVMYDFYILIETAYKYSVNCIDGALVTSDVFNQRG